MIMTLLSDQAIELGKPCSNRDKTKILLDHNLKHQSLGHYIFISKLI